MGFSRQEFWNGFLCHPPGNFPDPGIKPSSLISPALAGRFFNASSTWEAHLCIWNTYIWYSFNYGSSLQTAIGMVVLTFLFLLTNKICYKALAKEWESFNCLCLDAYGTQGCTVCFRPCSVHCSRRLALW